jgi:threonine aldolase
MMCFSKGLGAPIGSILAGPAAVVKRARRIRKRWGGGMRQVGIIAAACLHALDHHVARLADDHARAKRFAEGLAGLPGVRVIAPETNIVFARLQQPELATGPLLADLRSHGVLMSQYGPDLVRAIVHLDVDDAGIDRALEAFRAVVGERTGASTPR